MSVKEIKEKIDKKKEKIEGTFDKIKTIFFKLYNLGLKVGIAVSLILVIVQSFLDIYNDKVVFQPFTVPPALEEQGYTGVMIVKEIVDNIGYIREEVRKNDQEKFIEIEAMDQSENIELPGTGITLKDITDFLRTFLGTKVRSISGNVVMSGKNIVLTVRITDKMGKSFEGNLLDMDTLIKSASEHALKNIDPFTLGKYYFSNKNIKAMRELAEYVQSDSSITDGRLIGHLIDGLMLYEKKDWEGALYEWNMALMKDPKNINALVYKGWALDMLGRFDEAMANYKKVIEIDESNAVAYNNWGITLYRTGNVLGAIEKFKKLIELAPNYASGYNNLGYLLFEVGKYEEGIDYIKQAINLDPKDPSFYDSLSEGLFALKRYEEAITQYRYLLRLDPNNFKAYLYWGKSLDALGRHDEAPEKYAKAKELKAEKKK